MCAGWFDEITKDFDKTIKVLVREAAAGMDGMSVPTSEHQQKRRSVPNNVPTI
jgi:hypothetical protein